ncbi:MAG: TIGR01777 family oxidoreductase [Myxococcota bacterium]
MRILVTGATGFVGRSLVSRLLGEGHQVIAAVRTPSQARNKLGADPEVICITDDRQLSDAVERADAVVNLAGEGIFSGRWSAERKKALVDSRIGVTRRLVETIGAAKERPSVMISASAVGAYGDSGDGPRTEASDLADDFLARLCRSWEEESQGVCEFGTRLVNLRIGVVMGQGGGALQRMLPPFRLGVGGRLGHGRQWFSWIHLDDLTGLISQAISSPDWSGTFNATAPNPVTNTELTRSLGEAVGRKTPFPVPGVALRLILGEAANALLGGQKVIPQRALQQGFVFKFPTLSGALSAILSDLEVRLQAIPGGYQLTQKVIVPRPMKEVFDFFANPENLGLLTPPWMKFEFLDEELVAPSEGAIYNYRVGIGPLPMLWRSQLTTWRQNDKFVDVQSKGPYASWRHEHSFIDEGDSVAMFDTVSYRPPLRFLGRLIHPLLIAPVLKAIFGYRARVIGQRFPATAVKPVTVAV